MRSVHRGVSTEHDQAGGSAEMTDTMGPNAGIGPLTEFSPALNSGLDVFARAGVFDLWLMSHLPSERGVVVDIGK